MTKVKLHRHKQRNRAYLIINGITAVAGFIAGYTLIVGGYPNIGAVIAGIFCLILGLIEIASCLMVRKYGSKAIPPQLIFPTVRLWKSNNIGPPSDKTFQPKISPPKPVKRNSH
jgi:hypothetical protein